MWLFYYFNFERNYGVLQSKSPYFLLNKKINFNKNETNSKMENPTHVEREKKKEEEPCGSSHTKVANEEQNCDELDLAKEKRVIFFNSA